MDYGRIAKHLEKYVVDNSPSILTGIAVVGSLTTAVLSYREGFLTGMDAAAGHYEPLMEFKEPESLETKDLVKRYWKSAIPPVVTGTLTVAAIIGANRVGNRRAAALAAAYGLSQKAFDEYKEKVAEKLGEKKHDALRHEIAQEKMDRTPIDTREVIITGNGDYLCFDSITGRYFMSSQESIRRAENEINKQILDSDYASLTEFFDKLGLEGTSFSEEVGFTPDNMLDIYFSSTISKDGQPAISIQYTFAPVRNYFRSRH